MDRIDLETCLKRVCVMNIPIDITEAELASIMTRNFGPVEKSYMRHPKGGNKSSHKHGKKFRGRPVTKYGFVTFLHKESRDKAISQKYLDDHKGRRLQIKAFRSKNESRNQKMREIENQSNKSSELQEFELFKQFQRMKNQKRGYNSPQFNEFSEFQNLRKQQHSNVKRNNYPHMSQGHYSPHSQSHMSQSINSDPFSWNHQGGQQGKINIHNSPTYQ